MKFENRIAIKIAGEAGMGVDSTGAIVMKALKNLGYHIYGEREFASVIKGVGSNIQIEVSASKVRAKTKQCDIAIAIDREGLKDCLDSLVDGGVLIHGFNQWPKVIKDLPQQAEARNIQIHELPARWVAEENGGSIVMINVILLGYLWKVLGLSLDSLNSQIEHQFRSKPKLLPINFASCRAGFEFEVEGYTKSETLNIQNLKDSQKGSKSKTFDPQNTMIIDGNSAIAMGAIQAGVRAYYAYPMSPSSSILSTMAKAAGDFGLLVKQAEDEITVAQLTLGSMHTGTRALCATSGGGYDLMTETISLSGMIEVPWVCVLAQRPGPATGLPTWTAQGDLHLAVYPAHGEFARCVLAASDGESGFRLIQEALNLAEKFQIPVTVLTEAQIAMSYASEPIFDSETKIDRGGLITKDNQVETSQERYRWAENGVSTRWLPGSNNPVFYANGDEHSQDGSITEEAVEVNQSITKRLRKLETLERELPEPKVYGNGQSKLGIIGFGSTKNVILDVQDQFGDEFGFDYLHFEYIFPLKTNKLKDFFKNHKKVVIMEGNATGQLASLIKQETALEADEKYLKWDGRPFYVEEVMIKIQELLG
jgi:2-oxoglutarate ferredoxin oxidoreductase subunit alpha